MLGITGELTMGKKHSGLGIASFITSIAAAIFTFILLVIAGVTGASTPGGIDEESIEAVIIGLFLFAFLFLCLIALGLGIAGLIQKDRNKIFAILGTIFSAVTSVGTISIVIIGLAMG